MLIYIRAKRYSQKFPVNYPIRSKLKTIKKMFLVYNHCLTIITLKLKSFAASYNWSTQLNSLPKTVCKADWVEWFTSTNRAFHQWREEESPLTIKPFYSRTHLVNVIYRNRYANRKVMESVFVVAHFFDYLFSCRPGR